MIIHCLFVQRKQSYAGQCAPELYAAIDEYGDDDNPDYLIDEEADIKEDSSIDFYKHINIEVPDKDFNKLFFPEETPLVGSVSEGKGNI